MFNLVVPFGSPHFLDVHATSRSIVLSWSEVSKSDQNGVITGYTVYLMNLDRQDTEQIEFTVASTNLSIPNLIPYTTYGLFVSAHTVVGEGPLSNLSTIQTKEEG